MEGREVWLNMKGRTFEKMCELQLTRCSLLECLRHCVCCLVDWPLLMVMLEITTGIFYLLYFLVFIHWKLSWWTLFSLMLHFFSSFLLVQYQKIYNRGKYFLFDGHGLLLWLWFDYFICLSVCLSWSLLFWFFFRFLAMFRWGRWWHHSHGYSFTFVYVQRSQGRPQSCSY